MSERPFVHKEPKYYCYNYAKVDIVQEACKIVNPRLVFYKPKGCVLQGDIPTYPIGEIGTFPIEYC